MRGTMLMLSVAAIALAGCGMGHASETRIDGTGPTVERQFAVGAFTSVKVAGPFRVQVSTDGSPAVSARGPKGLIDRMQVEVRDGALVIGPEHERNGSNWNNFSYHGEPATVTVSGGMIDEAAVAGSGEVNVNRIAGDTFKGAVAGSGGLMLPAVQVQSLDLGIAGSGKIRASGTANEAKYGIAGSGDIDAVGVQTARSKAEIAGSGKIAANARENAKISLMGSGDVTVTGGGKCDVSRMGSGEAHCS